jgi:hypothetical protein
MAAYDIDYRRVQTADDMAQLTALLKSAAGQDF